jgi:solute carrier family 25 phosphate transporter 3
MPLLFPTQGTLHEIFHPAIPFGRHPETPAKPAPAAAPKRTPLQARSELYTAWSVIDDAKNKANALSAEATKELEKASAKAQAKTGQIEMYSAKFYAACTFGGLLACVSTFQGSFVDCLHVLMYCIPKVYGLIFNDRVSLTRL